MHPSAEERMERRRRNAHSRDTQPVTIGAGPAGVGNRVEGVDQMSAYESERVAKRAYERFEERGGEHGRDMEDWLEAERELMSRNGNQ
jgi:hypothetical protein